MEKIKAFIQSHAIHRPGIDLLHYSDAMELIDLCQATNVPVLGIDGFWLLGDRLQPFLEHSIDFSLTAVSYQEIKAFLASKEGLDLLFEIVL